MKKALIFAAITLCSVAVNISAVAAVELTGETMTQAQAWAIADGEPVTISASARSRLVDGYALLNKAAAAAKPIYGLTVGVGLNKDVPVISADDNELSNEVREASTKFNYSTLRAHSAGVGEPAPRVLTRLAMVIRLNTILVGHTGVQLDVADLYIGFLNNDITPIIPAIGTVGEADILLSSHVGLAMIGEWDVLYQGRRIDARSAMQDAGLTPLVPFGKDALSILSNNSFSVAYAMQGLRDAKHLLEVSPVVFALSLEGLNGNVAPFLPQTIDVRPFPQLAEAAEAIRDSLAGSYLWSTDDKRALQDPLSYRTEVYAIAAAEDALKHLSAMIDIQINHSDDNPALILGLTDQGQGSQVAQYFVPGGGAVFPTANFEPLPVALAVQQLNVALVHLAHNSVMRTIHLSDDRFTGLPRFLTAKSNEGGHSFGAVQKAFVDLLIRIKVLAAPVSFQGVMVAGNIEDTFTNLKLSAENLIQIVENTHRIYGFELLHSTQAIDLRRQDFIALPMGAATKKLYQRYRSRVPFVEIDRPYTLDIGASFDFIRSYNDR